MTNGPPSTAASSSKSPATNGSPNPPPQLVPPPAPSSSSYSSIAQPNPAQPSWSSLSTYPYAAYSPASNFAPNNVFATQVSNPSSSHYPNVPPTASTGHVSYYQHYRYTPATVPSAPPSIKPSTKAKKSQPTPIRPDTPPLPEPETYKHWDEAVKSFLLKAKLIQALKGFEHDMVVLNPQWEQEVIPKALKEMVAGLQLILDRIAGKKKADDEAMDTNPAVDILNTDAKSDEGSSVDERKLGYISLANGSQPRSHSSINKSISQFLARTRSRNDSSNRSEFLYTPAEKRRRLQEAGINLDDIQLSSCARVDAKPIDRDKQMQYDIAKNEGPLTKTVKHDYMTSPSSSSPQPTFRVTPIGQQSSTSTVTDSKPVAAHSLKKRKLVEFADNQELGEGSKNKRDKKSKGKRRDTEKGLPPPPDRVASGDEQEFESRITTDTQSALSVRLANIEEHLAVRYVPSIPRTFLARLRYLEDHLINLEKEYPPWAALHFNQPSRGWPAPPRATPIIVPLHLRSASKSQNPISTTATAGAPSSSTANNFAVPSTSAGSSATQTAGPSTLPPFKRKTNSSLHRAVLDRLEVQRALTEMRDGQQGT